MIHNQNLQPIPESLNNKTKLKTKTKFRNYYFIKKERRWIMKNDTLTIQEVYQKTRIEADYYYAKSQQKKITSKQKELYVNLNMAFNIVSAWLEQTKEINPK